VAAIESLGATSAEIESLSDSGAADLNRQLEGDKEKEGNDENTD
jgi:hypothetical protein